MASRGPSRTFHADTPAVRRDRRLRHFRSGCLWSDTNFLEKISGFGPVLLVPMELGRGLWSSATRKLIWPLELGPFPQGGVGHVEPRNPWAPMAQGARSRQLDVAMWIRAIRGFTWPMERGPFPPPKRGHVEPRQPWTPMAPWALSAGGTWPCGVTPSVASGGPLGRAVPASPGPRSCVAAPPADTSSAPPPPYSQANGRRSHTGTRGEKPGTPLECTMSGHSRPGPEAEEEAGPQPFSLHRRVICGPRTANRRKQPGVHHNAAPSATTLRE